MQKLLENSSPAPVTSSKVESADGTALESLDHDLPWPQYRKMATLWSGLSVRLRMMRTTVRRWNNPQTGP